MELVRLEEGKEESLAEAVAARIKAGQVVITPTDTVYGLIADGFNRKASERLYTIKSREKDKPLIGFVPDLQAAAKYASIAPEHWPLVRKSWPGPVTFIFPGRQKIPPLTSPRQEIGLRVPDHPFLKRLLPLTGLLSSTSANFSGQPAACCVEEISPRLAGLVDLVLDGGRVAGTASTIWHLGSRQPRLVRGLVLFICEGNSCRSPMAEYLLREEVGKVRVAIQVLSAGLNVAPAAAVSEKAVQALAEKGIKVAAVTSQPVTPELLRKAALIFVMEEEQKNRVEQVLPEAAGKMRILNVPDPAGGDMERYRWTRERLSQALKESVWPEIWTEVVTREPRG